MSVNYWSNEEIKFLTENCEEMTDKELGEKLSRTIPSIRGKRFHINLVKIKNRGQFKKILIPPKERLKELYLKEDKTPTRIAEIFHVSSNTTLRWLSEYNIPLKRPYTSYIKSDLSEAEKAYFAGYLDGDGTINVGTWKNKKNKKGYGLHYDVSLISKNKNFIETLEKIIGGKVNSFIYHDSRSKKEGYRLGFCNQASALAFLKAIVPYLILKKKQAELMISFFEERLEKRRENGNAVIISDRLYEVAKEVKRLNRA